MVNKTPDIVPALIVVGGVFTLGYAIWALSDKARYSSPDHKRLVDQGVAMAVARREKLGRPLSHEEISALIADFREQTKEPLSGMDQKRIWNAARG